MYKSRWKCPDCKRSLYVTNSAQYWCDACQKEHPANNIDPMARDVVMNTVHAEYQIELNKNDSQP